MFRWTGRHIEPRLRFNRSKMPKVTPEIRTQYIQLLGETLEQGLYAKIPDGDILGNGEIIRLNRPCLCFTELRLGESLEHWRRYGRLSFGFTKSFISRRGGGSVSYINGKKQNPIVRHIEKLSKYLNGKEGAPSDSLHLLWHYFKRMKDAPQTRKNKSPSRPGRVKSHIQNAISPEEKDYNDSRYPLVKPLPYLDEHEWRLVYEKGEGWKADEGIASPSEAWFEFKLGTDLQIVIVPDNYTLQKVLQSTDLTEMLFPKQGRPPIQVLSIEAVYRV